MQKTYKIVIVSIIGASILFTGCSWIKEKLQGAVDEANKGIESTVKDVGNQIKGETTPPATPATETPAPAATPAK